MQLGLGKRELGAGRKRRQSGNGKLECKVGNGYECMGASFMGPMYVCVPLGVLVSVCHKSQFPQGSSKADLIIVTRLLGKTLRKHLAQGQKIFALTEKFNVKIQNCFSSKI